ncbi:MAG: hypothetical protein D8M61_16665, partial [Ignavibacteriae bacterium]|nr:hypothetical protein [Ignavibacteriota bacterium]
AAQSGLVTPPIQRYRYFVPIAFGIVSSLLQHVKELFFNFTAQTQRRGAAKRKLLHKTSGIIIRPITIFG